MLYALKAPRGQLVPESVATSRREVVYFQFDFLARQDSNFRTRYWKRLEAGNRAAKRRGWKIVPVALTEVA